jgi:hypothetical protein
LKSGETVIAERAARLAFVAVATITVAILPRVYFAVRAFMELRSIEVAPGSYFFLDFDGPWWSRIAFCAAHLVLLALYRSPRIGSAPMRVVTAGLIGEVVIVYAVTALLRMRGIPLPLY